MPRLPEPVYPTSDAAPDLVSRAASIVAREAGRLPAMALGQSGWSGGMASPDVAQLASAAGPAAEKVPVADQAHDLLSRLLATLGQGPGGPVPAQTFGDDLRKQAHEFLETLLVTFHEATGEKGLPTEDRVPLICYAAPIQAGKPARVTLTVSNEEATPSTVSLCWTNFVSDGGHEITSLKVSVSPRTATIPAHGEAPFEITIAVPEQVPAGTYSGLIQATGSKYVKAVLSITVL